MKLTPDPLVVFAIITVGLPPFIGIFLNTFKRSDILFPFVKIVSKPNDSNFLSMGSIGLTSSVFPVICKSFLSIITIKLSNLY